MVWKYLAVQRLQFVEKRAKKTNYMFCKSKEIIFYHFKGPQLQTVPESAAELGKAPSKKLPSGEHRPLYWYGMIYKDLEVI